MNAQVPSRIWMSGLKLLDAQAHGAVRNQPPQMASALGYDLD